MTKSSIMRRVPFLSGLSIVIISLFMLSCTRKTHYHLVWSDEFNGSALDTTQWHVITGNASQYGKAGYGNGELEYYTGRPQNISVKNGKLMITARNENYKGENYTSGRIRTRDHFAWKYGKIVARIKLPYGHGMWPAFWMLPTENKTGLGSRLSKTPEIDIMEMIGRNPATDYGTGHWWNHGAKMMGGHFKLKKGNLSNAYHTYAIIWGPDRIQWLFDGKPYYQINRDRLKTKKWPFDKKFTPILNLAVGGTWPHNPDSTTRFPQTMKVDYVRVYKKGTSEK